MIRSICTGLPPSSKVRSPGDGVNDHQAGGEGFAQIADRLVQPPGNGTAASRCRECSLLRFFRAQGEQGLAVSFQHRDTDQKIDLRRLLANLDLHVAHLADDKVIFFEVIQRDAVLFCQVFIAAELVGPFGAVADPGAFHDRNVLDAMGLADSG